MQKTRIKWCFETDVIKVMDKYEKHNCKEPNYILSFVRNISDYKEEIEKDDKFSPTYIKYEAELYCLGCCKSFRIIFKYGYNDKIDYFEVIEIRQVGK